jgi:hypothetical protein
MMKDPISSSFHQMMSIASYLVSSLHMIAYSAETRAD